MSYQIRFNLGRGENYMKWQVKDNEGNKSYYDTDSVSFLLENCVLKNRRKTADKIFKGSHKTVCAWIEFDQLTIVEDIPSDNLIPIRYNPRVAPYWHYLNDEDIDLDKSEFNKIIITEKKIFIWEN